MCRMLTENVEDICNLLISCSSLSAVVASSMELHRGQEIKIGLVPENMQMGLDPTLTGTDGKPSSHFCERCIRPWLLFIKCPADLANMIPHHIHTYIYVCVCSYLSYLAGKQITHSTYFSRKILFTEKNRLVSWLVSWLGANPRNNRIWHSVFNSF